MQQCSRRIRGRQAERKQRRLRQRRLTDRFDRRDAQGNAWFRRATTGNCLRERHKR